MEKEKEELNNDKLNEQKPAAAGTPAEEKVSTVNGDQISEKATKGNKEEEATNEVKGTEENETPVLVAKEKVIVKEQNSHVYRIKPRVDKGSAPGEKKEFAKPEATPAESSAPVKEPAVEPVAETVVKPVVEAKETVEPVKQENKTPDVVKQPVEPVEVKAETAAPKIEDVKVEAPAVEKQQTENIIAEPTAEGDTSAEVKTDEAPKTGTQPRQDRRGERPRRDNRENLKNQNRHNQRQQQENKELTPDPTIVNIKVDKGLVKTPADQEAPKPVVQVPERKEPVRSEERKPEQRREPKPEPVVRQEPKPEPVVRQDNRDRDRDRNRDRDRDRDRKPSREPYKPAERQQSTQQQQPQPQRSRFKTNFTKVSIVVPLYNEDESLIHLANEIKSTFRDLPIQGEVIFVDDGSSDKSLRIIKDICRTDQRFKYISFQMNYGKSAALNMGFRAAKGDVVVTMDADLQDDPHEIPNLLKKLEEGYDMVSGWKKKRYDPFIKKYTSKLFNFVTATMSGIKLHDFNCGLKAYRKNVVDNLTIYGEMHRYIPILAKWKGFTVTELVVKHSPRKYGVTKFGASRFFKGFVDLITVTFITRYIKRPMHLFGFFGALAFLLGFAINGYLSYEWIFEQQSLSNRPLLQLGMLLMIVGVQFFTTGLLGEMLVHNFQTEKEYSIKETNTRG